MKNNQYFLNTLLAIVLFVACAIALLVRVWLPAAIIPELNIPNMVALSVIALLIEHFFVGGNPRCYICIPVFAMLSFGILPLMAGFACQYGKDACVTIVSQDSDLFQLITEKVHILRYRGENTIICDPAYIKERLGIDPGQYVDYKSLTGDTADNIRGADRVGPKTAAALMRQFGTLENLLQQMPAITKPALRASLESCGQRLLRNQRLIRLDAEQPLPFTRQQLQWQYRGQTTGRVLSAIGLE